MAWVFGCEPDKHLDTCCGVGELGDFNREEDVPDWNHEDAFSKLKNIERSGTGLFVTTVLPSQEGVIRSLQRRHTLLFKVGPVPSTAPYASPEGREKGIILCVFKYGKEIK